jgi:hypothetical protein
MTWPIGFSSLIGCSFILEEAVIPESAKDSGRYRELMYYAFPEGNTGGGFTLTNPLERILCEIRRRTGPRAIHATNQTIDLASG